MTIINALLQRGLKKIWASRSGGVLIYVAFGLPILLGAMALSIDLGRAFILNTELKDFSDAAALAGAAELDGRDGARVASEAAARTGITNTLVNFQGFATDGGGPNIAVDQVVFLKQLPADGTDFQASDTATSDADARFIFVSVVDRDVRAGLSRALGVVGDFDTGAKSIAGFIEITCKVPVMFMCNPLEGDGQNNTDPFPVPLGADPPCQLGLGAEVIGQEHCLVGRGMRLKKGNPGGGNQGFYFPGEFGLLQCPPEMGGPGASCVAQSIAQAEPGNCIGGRAMIKTGHSVGPINQAINVRFDHYGPFFGGNNGGGKNPEREDYNYRPALNVQKGWQPATGNDCSEPSVDPDTRAFPRDSCFYNGPTCERYGMGDWHIGDTGTAGEDYWTANHAGDMSVDQPDGSGGYKAYADMTRYEVYRYEIEMEIQNPGTGIPQTYSDPPDLSTDVSKMENGKACNYDFSNMNPNGPPYTGFSDPALAALGATGADLIDRRLLYLAIVNCVELGPLQGASSNNPDGLEIKGVGEIFLTEPAHIPGQQQEPWETVHDIWGEIAGILDTDSLYNKDIVQLYR